MFTHTFNIFLFFLFFVEVVIKHIIWGLSSFSFNYLRARSEPNSIYVVLFLLSEVNWPSGFPRTRTAPKECSRVTLVRRIRKNTFGDKSWSFSDPDMTHSLFLQLWNRSQILTTFFGFFNPEAPLVWMKLFYYKKKPDLLLSILNNFSLSIK